MQTAVPRGAARRSCLVLTVLGIGLIAGTLDITDALVFSWIHGVGPTRVFQYIASGLVGRNSFQLGAMSVALGVILHYVIALSWTGIFCLVSSRLTVLRRWAAISGLIYGALVYLVMNFIVLPLSRVPHMTRPMTLASRINGVMALLLCIGLTISLLMRRWVSSR